ncbi:MAG: DUF4115 domain-containing protein [Alphaproteobacteria bacterium]|nr:DUF4115 domain-containing protein [Alphaproteobacteria bacterium]
MAEEINKTIVIKKEPEKEKVSEILQTARLKQKKEIESAAKKLCIRKVYLEALESDDTHRLPGHAYTIGFLQSYAEYLRLDSDKLIKQYREEHPDVLFIRKKTEDETVPLYRNKHYLHMQYAVLALSGLVILFVVYFMIRLFVGNGEDSSSKKEVPTEQEGISAEVLQEYSFSTKENPEITPLVTEEGKLHSTVTPEPVVPNKITLKAEEDVWVELTDSTTQKIIFSRILKKDEIYEMDSDNNVLLTTGNAGGLQILIGEKEVEKMGARGVRRSHIHMDSESLLNGTAYRKESINQ